MSRPCKLQINTAGAWRDVLRFDLDVVNDEDVQVAAAQLLLAADPDSRASLRIVMDDSLQTPLVRWNTKKGWIRA